MYLINVLKQALRILAAQKSRSFLTMLGIVIGVAAVISIMAVGASAQDLLLDQVRAMGSNIIGVLPGGSEENAPPAALFGIEVTTLKYEDGLAMQELACIEAACSYIKGRGTVNYFRETKDCDYNGVSETYVQVEDTSVAQGRFFRREEVDSLSRVAVLGSQVKEELFGLEAALGKRIKINQIGFRVIGVMKERGTATFQNQDDQIFIPIKTAQKLLLGVDHLAFIRLKVDNAENVDLAISQAKDLLRYRHNIKDPTKDDFSIRSTDQALEMLGTITQALKIFLAAVAAISLIVGGVGIMNIMFVVVNERTKEVGLRKAVGASRRDIMFHFLIESMVITLIGGVIGILLGLLIAFVVFIGVNYYGYDWNYIITPFSIFISTLTAISVGVIFGLWPAYRASKMDPISALRYE